MTSEARAANPAEHFSPGFFSWSTALVRVRGAAIFVGLCLAAALLFTGLFYVWTSMRQVQIGYEISSLESKNRELKNRKRELLLEIASLQSPGELEKKARKHGLVFPSMGKVVHVP
jgi:cell division protein FtsL